MNEEKKNNIIYRFLTLPKRTFLLVMWIFAFPPIIVDLLLKNTCFSLGYISGMIIISIHTLFDKT